MMRWALVLGVVGLVGCASQPVTWRIPPGASQQQFQRDNYACVHENQQYYYGSTGLSAVMAREQARKNTQQMYQMCMGARGYVPVRE